MSEAVAARTIMQSALDQWSALDELSSIAKRILPPEKAETFEAPLRKTADECLQILAAPTEQVVSERVGDGEMSPEISELIVLRSKLRKMSTKFS